MTVLVTGAGGLVGSNVVRALEDAGRPVRAMLRPAGHGRALDGSAAERVAADLREPGSLRRAAAGADVVVHCAAVYSYAAAVDELHETNVQGTVEVLRAASDVGVRRVVVVSSSVTCGGGAGPEALDETGRLRSPTPYFRSKLAQEQVAREVAEQVGLELVIACPTVVLGGPDGKLVPSNAIVVRYLLDPTRTTFVGGANVVSVRDVAAGLALLADRGEPGERYLLGGENWTWRLLHTAVAELAGVPGPFLTAGTTAAYLGAAAAELVGSLTGRSPLATRDEALTTGTYFWYDDRRARALGYASRPARQAVAEALGWISTTDHLPRVVREHLRLAPEVVRSRRLLPAPLPAT